MMSMSAAIERAIGMSERGELDCGKNVAVVRMMGVRIIAGRMPASVRKELNEAVKAGKLGRLPKKGLMPEAYFHPNAKGHAIELREKEAGASIEALKKVCA